MPLRGPVVTLLALTGAAAAQPGWTYVILPMPGWPSGQVAAITHTEAVGFVETPGGPGSHREACLWTRPSHAFASLHPAGAVDSEALGASPGQQVGRLDYLTQNSRAVMWAGSAASALVLHPPGDVSSMAYAACGSEQVGRHTTATTSGSPFHACLWRGSAGSMVDLSVRLLPFPGRQSSSEALASNGTFQVGYASDGLTPRAIRWQGSAATWQDLGALIPVTNGGSAAEAIASNGQVVGRAFVGSGFGAHACIWDGTTWTDISPVGAFVARALATTGAVQAGYARFGSFTGPHHAGMWNNSAVSWVELHALFPSGTFTDSMATSVIQEGGILHVGGWAGTGALRSAVLWTGPAATVCYANCDTSTAPPVLNVDDFVCFQARFAAGDPRANCDGSTAAPTLNVNDFVCFQARFAAGCP